MPDISQQDLSFQPAAKGYSFSTNPVKPSQPEKPQIPKKTSPLLVLILEIIGFITIFMVFLLILNFFNILSLSKIYPNQLGWLPHLNQMNISNTQNQKTSNNQQPALEDSRNLKVIPMGSCPLPNGCQSTVQISSVSSDSAQENFSGLGFILTGSDSAILAMREGKISIENTIENDGNLTVVTITDPANIQKYVYKFNKDAYLPLINSGSVKEGQKIGDLKNTPTITYSSKLYSFILYMQIIKSKSYVKLEPSVDEKMLNSSNE